MDGQHLSGAGNRASPLAISLNGPTIFSNLVSSLAPDDQSGGLNLIDFPLTLSTFNGYPSNITFTAADELLVSSINLPLSGLPDGGIYRMSDGGFLNSSDIMPKKESRSPINILVGSDGMHSHGPGSPTHVNLSSMQFHSMVSGGDKMLSAVNSLNFNDPEMLGDSAFDSTSSSGLAHFDDGLLSGLGSSSQGMRLGDGCSGTSFDLFDGEVTDGLSLSPQPFSDTGLMSDSGSVLDSGLGHQQSDTLLDTRTKSSSSADSPDLSGQNKAGPSQCPLCCKTFSNFAALSKHRLTHSDERKYVCKVCSKGFKRQDHLNGHLMTHLDKKPYECQAPDCDKGYCDARSLRRHLEQHHQLDPDSIQSYVQASMAAAGIAPPTPRHSSKKGSEGRGKHLSSPVYSPGSTTPSPSPGSGGATNVFHFDTQQTKSNQQKQQHELLVQQIHQQQKLLLQQQQLQQQEESVKEHLPQANDASSQHLQLQLQLQQQHLSPSADMLAVIQQVQQIHQQLDIQKKAAAVAAEQESPAPTVLSPETGLSWQDKAGVYTFVGTPPSSEPSPVSRNDQSPNGIQVSGEMLVRSPVSPVTSQPISPLTNSASRAIWYTSSPDSSLSSKQEEVPKTQAYCSTCSRYFKNAAALNGHMRCHGGYLKKGKEGKKSPVRKSSSTSEMGPPLRRPPHASTPSPQPATTRTSPTIQPAVTRTSPTMPVSSVSFVPSTHITLTSSQPDHTNTLELISTSSPSDQSSSNLAMKSDKTTVSTTLPQQKHKHLQEQLSSHILKKRMSGDLQVQWQQQKNQMQQQQQQQQKNQMQQQQKNQMQQQQKNQMHLMEEQIKQQLQNSTQHSLQLMPCQLLEETSNVTPVTLEDISAVRTASPHQGEHIQRLVQSFQQVEEFQRQQQHQTELPHLSAEQLDMIRQQHKQLGLPPLNPQQLQYQLQEEQNQLLQAQLRELQGPHHHQLEPGTLVMASSPLTQQQLLQHLQGAHITSTMGVATQAVTLTTRPTLVQLTSHHSSEEVDSRSSLPSQMTPNTSVQRFFASLDPSVISAAGINLSEHQHLLAQLQRQPQQSQQQHVIGMHIPSPVTTLNMSGPAATLIAGQMPGLHVSQIPQILLQPPDADDLSGVPTISIPDTVVLGSPGHPVIQANLLESEQEQLERIHNGLIQVSGDKQEESVLAHPTGAHLLNSGTLGSFSLEQVVPSFINVQSSPRHVQSSVDTQNTFGSQRRDLKSLESGSRCQQPEAAIGSLGVMSSASSSSLNNSSSSSTLASSRSTDAAVAQILRNISNSMAQSSGLLVDNSCDTVTTHGLFGASGMETASDRSMSYPSFQTFSFSKPFKDSIKQDVMLSSTLDSDSGHISSAQNDSLVRDDVVPYVPKPSRVLSDYQNSKRRLSADLESHRTSSSFSCQKFTLAVNPQSMLVNPLEVESLIPGRTRVRSKSGDINYKYVRSKSVDHSTMRPRSFTEDSIFQCSDQLDGTFIKTGKVTNSDQDLFSRSDGSGVFRNPSSLPSSLKIKRKHRPAPLYIPPQFGIFQSRLRSPRVIGKDGYLSSDRGRGHTPPPYTPPPMLSPFRSGSGLFCTLQSSQPQTPKSAPISGKPTLSQRGSFGSGRLDFGFNLFSDQAADTDVPETDTLAHINVGYEYQAVLPELKISRQSWDVSESLNEQKWLLWHPSSQGDNTDSQLQCYQDFSCSAAVKGNGCNVEYALHLLHLAGGDITEAMLMLMADPPMLPVGHPMLDYKYQESDSWNSSEMERFYKSIMVHDKDFFKVSKDVGTKSVKQCVQFYYVWKKVCPDDYRRLRLGRGKHNDYNTRRSAIRAAAAAAEKVSQSLVTSTTEPQPSMPNLAMTAEAVEENVESVDSDNTSFISDNDETSMAPDSVQSSVANTACSTPTRGESPAPLPPPQFSCSYQGCHVTCASKQSLKRHLRKHQEKPQSSPSMPKKPRPATPSRSPVYDQFGEEIFPCRLCGRVFSKVKSRSAHMKSHKIAEQQEKKAAELTGIVNSNSLTTTTWCQNAS